MFSLHYRELWSSVSAWLTDELDQMAASAQVKWSAQHRNDGTHGDVTAGTLRAQSLATSVYTYVCDGSIETGGESPGIMLSIPAKTSALVLKRAPGAGVVFDAIHSIDMPNVAAGDLLAVVVQTPGIYLLHSAQAQVPGGSFPPYYPIGNRIALGSSHIASGTTDSVNYFDYLSGVTGCLLMRVDAYDYESSPFGQRYPCWVQIG